MKIPMGVVGCQTSAHICVCTFHEGFVVWGGFGSFDPAIQGREREEKRWMFHFSAEQRLTKDGMLCQRCSLTGARVDVRVYVREVV